MEKKKDFHQPENSFPLPRISFPQQEFFKKSEFRLILIMVSTSRKEALNPFPLAGKRLLLKIGFLPISISRKMRLFFGNLILSNFNNGSHQQNCKILSCLGEIVFFYSEFLLVEPIIKTWMPIFKEKLLCSQQKLFFWLVKNSFFHLSDISGCENSFSIKWKRIFQQSLYSGQWKRIFCLAETYF